MLTILFYLFIHNDLFIIKFHFVNSNSNKFNKFSFSLIYSFFKIICFKIFKDYRILIILIFLKKNRMKILNFKYHHYF